MKKTFVGFGFGPIQSALFLLEAFRSGNFDRYVVAEIDPKLVAAVRKNRGRYTVNIAHPDRIEQITIGPIEIYNPARPADRKQLLAAVAQADEFATALPSVRYYSTSSAGIRRGKQSVVSVLAEGLRRRDPAKPAILYAAENHNHAAEILHDDLAARVPAAALRHLQFLNTVIGKMSGTITDAPTIARLRLAPLTPHTPLTAILAEAFNRILISQITLPHFSPGIPAFIQKPDLLPFEEAKLYGHNAIHALIGYLAAQRHFKTIASAAACPDILATARAAFLNESGPALIRKYAALGGGGDPLFTPAGFRAYAEDLLTRMANPYLNDLVARVIRDPVRKLGWDDRFFGTMRLCLAHGIEPTHLARGAAAAALRVLRSGEVFPRCTRITDDDLDDLCAHLWGDTNTDLAQKLITLTWIPMFNMLHPM
jgi:mannitol-1-phosphate 5-dehydrogenase